MHVTGQATISARLKAHLDAFVHPVVALHATEAAGHAAFICARTSTSMLALALVPLFLALHGAPSPWQALALLWMVMPLLAVGVISRTGRMGVAQTICIISLFGLSLTFAVGGGLGAALAWLLLVPLEAALTMQGTAILMASFMTVMTACALYMMQVGGVLPEAIADTPLERIGLLLPGIVYGATLAHLAVVTHNLHRRAELIGAARLQSLSDAIGDLVLRHDGQGNVFHASSESLSLFGHQPQQLMGRGFFDHVHVGDRPAFLKLIADASRQDGTLTANLRLRQGNAGTVVGKESLEPVFAWIEVRARAIPFDAGATSGAADPATVLAVVRDVSVRRQHEDEIESARLKAEQASLWKDRFLANVSHELRTPLNAIIGFSEMLGNEQLTPKEPEKQREYATIIHDSGQHLLSVVNTILDMSKIEAGSFDLVPEAFEVAPLLSLCCDMISLRAKQGGVELLRDCPGNLEEIVADKRACKQILINLLSNAVKFTRPGGQVVVGARPDGNSMRFFVTDTGIGIQPRDLPRLGDPFFQATATYDRAFEGTGLGLSVVRGLVGLHGGEIRIESTPGVGTTVSVRLPLDCRYAKRQLEVLAKIETFPGEIPISAASFAEKHTGMKKSA